MSTNYYAIQGKRNGEWVTLFAPFARAADAKTRTDELIAANPACRYRWVRIADGVVYV